MWISSLATIVPFLLFVGVESASTEDLTGLPSCGQTCLVSAFVSDRDGCTETDYSCLCRSTKFQNAITSCFTGNCSSSDATTSQAWSVKNCASAGVTVSNNTNGTTTSNSTSSSNGSSTASVNAKSSAAKGLPSLHRVASLLLGAFAFAATTTVL